MTVLANQDNPVENLCMVFKHWDSKQEVSVMVDGKQLKNKQGIVRDTDGSCKLIVWIRKSSNQAFNMNIRKV